jgi:transposase
MESFLTEQEVAEYKKLHKQYKLSKQADRIKAILMLNKGYSYEKIAELLLIDQDTVREWYKLHQKGGSKELLANHYNGSEPKLNMAEQEELSHYLEDHLCLSSKQISHYVQAQFGKQYTIKGMTCLLHRLDFVYKKPKHLPSKADREKQETFIKEYFALKESKKPEDRIYFMDGTHPMHNSQLAYGWIKKGKDKFIKANTGRERVNINGAYNVEEHKAVVREDESINAQSTVALLKQMLKEQPLGILYIILDNARYYHAEHVKEFLSKNPRIELKFLPPYSPNLNLIERLWKFLKEKVTYNQYYEKFGDFKEKIGGFFENIDSYRDELKSLMSEKFQLFPT